MAVSDFDAKTVLYSLYETYDVIPTLIEVESAFRPYNVDIPWFYKMLESVYASEDANKMRIEESIFELIDVAHAAGMCTVEGIITFITEKYAGDEEARKALTIYLSGGDLTPITKKTILSNFTEVYEGLKSQHEQII